MVSRLGQRTAVVLGLGLALGSLSALTAPPVSANPAGTGLVINEVYGAGGNSGALRDADYVELYNPTAAPIDLAGTSVHYRAAGGGSGGAPYPLSGTVPADSTFLIRMSVPGANGAPLPTPDAVAAPAFTMAAAGGQVFLLSGTAPVTGSGNMAGAAGVLDMVGAAGASSFETAPASAAATTTRSLHRGADGADSDDNGVDFTQGDPSPTNAAGESTAALAASAPAVRAWVTGSAVAAQLGAEGGVPPYAWQVSGLPAGLSADAAGAITGTPTTAGTSTVTATVTDAAGTEDSVTFELVIEDGEPVAIAEVQGTGAASPRVGRAVRVQGVVTALYRTGGLDGLYLQTPGPDATPGASDALFVYGGPGAANLPAGVAIGDSLAVAGVVAEFNGLTQLVPASTGFTELDDSLGTAEARRIAYPTTVEGREAHEGELLAPTDELAVTNVFAVNQYAEVGLATGGRPLVQPSEVSADPAEIAEIRADNAARSVVLDDGATTNFLTGAGRDLPVPWLTRGQAPRVGAGATLAAPVVLDYRNNTWKLQPTRQVSGDGREVVDFEDTRAVNLAPADVGGDVRIATFNVLNYFNTTGQAYVAAGAAQNPPVNTQCTYYEDRAGTPIANNRCGVVTNGANAGNGPRGAATDASLARQQAKIVTAINALDADVVALEEVENSVKLVGETNRDDALATLVAALNAEAGAGTWRFVHSPAEALVAGAVAEQDSIRSAFIYRPAAVQPVGQSDILFGTPEFANAREPLAQAFKARGALDSAAFAVVANHFKSKGDSDPAAVGDNADHPDFGAFNGDRVRQARRLAAFSEEFARARGTGAVFLVGDFNSYSAEEPITVLGEAGYLPIESDTAGEETYSFSGLSGSLDHVLANPAGRAMRTGSDIWEINANESPAFQYSRYNYHGAELFDPSTPFAASDHNPHVVGLDLPDVEGDYTPVQLLATNDFHGRLLADGANAAGAAVLSGAVKQLRGENRNTVFAAAGDLIGASTFESFIAQDVPTIEALNEAGLEVSAAGNHEFDAGYEDLVGRVQDLADWEYLAANVVEPAGRDELAETWTQTFGDVEIGFVGAVTEDLPSLVSPSGIEGVSVTDIVEATNAAAAELKDDGADLVVLLVHEGAPSTDCAAMTRPDTTWGAVVTGVGPQVDAIVSGHTHLAYNCSFPVPQWADRAVTERPVVSAGQYGTHLNQLVFTFDDATGALVESSQDVIGLVGTGYAADPAVTAIVDEAVAAAEVAGAEVLGTLAAPFNRAKLSSGAENRGGESTLGNLVAEVQRWATRNPESGAAEIAFMNPGGLRQDMVGTVTGGVRNLTYKQAAVVQPFANTLVNMDLSGADLKRVLEQQWQRDAAGNVPSRPFLRLGVSAGFTYTFDASRPEGDRITGMWLDGRAVAPASTYSVTVNSFLASGGDNFRAFADGTDRADTGKVDLQAMVDYLEANATEAPLPVDYRQRAVGISFPAGAPAAYGPGDTVAFAVSSWAMSTGDDVRDDELEVRLGEQALGTATVDNTVGTAALDDHGTAAVRITLPAGLPAGVAELTLVGPVTGTVARVPLTLRGAGSSTVRVGTVRGTYGRRIVVPVTVRGGGTGTVEVRSGTRVLGRAALRADGTARVALRARSMTPGAWSLRAVYAGDASHPAASAPFTLRVAKATSRVRLRVSPRVPRAGRGQVLARVRVSGSAGVVPTGTVRVGVSGRRAVTVRLRQGRAVVRLGTLRRGRVAVRAVYAGNRLLAAASAIRTVRVRR